MNMKNFNQVKNNISNYLNVYSNGIHFFKQDDKFVFCQVFDKREVYNWVLFFVSCFAVKIVLFYIDPWPTSWGWDSLAYLGTAVYGWFPLDRSFVYGIFIRLFAVLPSSLTSLVISQIFLNILCVILLAYILTRFFSVPQKIAFALGILCLVEPLQLLYERFIMTETCALFALVLYLTLIFHYLEKPKLIYILLIQIAGVVLISFRLSFLPLVFFNSILVPVLKIPYFFQNKHKMGTNASSNEIRIGPALYLVVLHLVASIIFIYLFHSAYKDLNGHLTKMPPAYQYRSGLFLLADWGPIVEPIDFSRPELSGPIFQNLSYDLKDRDSRTSQRWEHGGLIDRIEKTFPNPIDSSRVAGETAINAAKRDPISLARLVKDSFLDYWNLKPEYFLLDSGYHTYVPHDVLKVFSDSSKLDLGCEKTFTKAYFLKSLPWFLFLLCLPLIILISFFVCDRSMRQYIFLVFVTTSEILVIATAFIERPTIRYLHALGWLVFLVIGPLVSRLIVVFQKKVNR
jgi:hypothetical protein